MLQNSKAKSDSGQIINEQEIFEALTRSEKQDPVLFHEVLSKARELKGLNLWETAFLSGVSDPQQLEELYAAARWAKETIYGKRLVLFAPLYISNHCNNECLYCAFRRSNFTLVRKRLTQQEIADETSALVSQGHKRVLLVSGAALPEDGMQYILNSIETIYKTAVEKASIRRINVNIAPLAVEGFRLLKNARIGTYQLFQETYHRPTYKKMHPSGAKADYDWYLQAMDRAMGAGIDDVGLGALFGLYDWRFEVLALLQHSQHLERKFGVGCHTISVPRLEPACGSRIAASPPAAVSDQNFKKLVSIIRLSVPYTGIIMSTRETAEMRAETFALGVSQISAGSRTNPGGYSSHSDDYGQFSLGDHRSLEEVIQDVAKLGYIPSFCTACYRLGRTGQDFMDLAKPGEIKKHCDPNALSTFREYLRDYASDQTRQIGEKAIEQALEQMQPEAAKTAKLMLARVKLGRSDVLC